MRTPLTQSEIVVGLDLGTTKVSAVVGEVDADGITILSVGNVPCRGLRKGVVSNMEWTMRSVREAIEAAQTMAGVEIKTVYAGIAGSHIRSQVSDGVCAISGREVTRADLDRVLEGARAIPVDSDRMILHALPREYVVDNQDGIRDPIGMSGVRLQARVNLVTAATSCVENVIRCVERCGLTVADVVLEPRVEEIFSEARRRIEETGLLEQVSSGCVLTGGAALMEGMVECAEEILGMPVRLGFPVGVKGIVQLVQGPQYATGVGLLRYGAQQLVDAGQRGASGSRAARPEELEAEAMSPNKSGFWSWFRAAF